MGTVRARRTGQAADGRRLPRRAGRCVPAVEAGQRVPRHPRKEHEMKTPWCCLLALLAATAAGAQTRPNIVIIMTDDLGYGDASSYGATSVTTPSIDRLAKEGLRFTDAHSPAATCTPSRYTLLTGEYAFRKPGTAILPGD